jgi:hypothetical protein
MTVARNVQLDGEDTPELKTNWISDIQLVLRRAIETLRIFFI